MAGDRSVIEKTNSNDKVDIKSVEENDEKDESINHSMMVEKTIPTTTILTTTDPFTTTSTSPDSILEITTTIPTTTTTIPTTTTTTTTTTVPTTTTTTTIRTTTPPTQVDGFRSFIVANYSEANRELIGTKEFSDLFSCGKFAMDASFGK